MRIEDKRFLVGVFDDDDHLVHALKELRESNIKIYDIYTPFPLHGVDEYLEIKRSRLPIVCFVASIFGAFLAFYFQIWTSKYSWPINVGGKPFNSFLAFVPVAFEITVLLGALVTVAAFLFRAKLFPQNKLILPHQKLTDNKFVIAIEEENAALDVALISEIFKKNKAEEILSNEGAEWCQTI